MRIHCIIFWRIIPADRCDLKEDKTEENGWKAGGVIREIVMKKRIGVIGGGAAGMAAAITAARQGAEVTVFERNDRVGKKILVTGNGKCNLGNYQLGTEQYYGSSAEFIGQALKRFDTDDTVAFFQGLGLLIKSKNGYLYPACEQASAVLDVLRFEMQSLGIVLVKECKINHIEKDVLTGQVKVSDGETHYSFDAVILACGSKAAPKTGSDGSGYKLAKKLGHSIVPTVPALVQLKCREDYLKAVAGVRSEGEVAVYQGQECVARERGELQFTEYGISGIPVFQISRVVNYILRKEQEVCVELNLLPDYNEEEFERLIAGRELLQSERTAEEFFTGILNKKLMQLFIKMAGIKSNMPMEQMDAKSMRRIYDFCRKWQLHVTGSNPYDNAQVCAGGVNTAEITENMESKLVDGVYFAGEIMDVDGKCGGYNLQWAWCSGVIAGRAAAQSERI